VAQSPHDRRRCRRPLSGAPLTDRILSSANRSARPRRNRPPGPIGNGAARVSCGDTPPGKRCRLGPLNPHSKVMEVSNQLGHFINALKQSLNTTKTTHIRHSHKPPEVQHIATTCTTRQGFPTPEEYCSTKGECSKPMRERPQGLRPTRLSGTRARSGGPCNTVQNRKKLPISRPAEKDQSPRVQADTRRTRLRTCTSNSASVVSRN
jgi:hypothetical protein